MYNAKNIVSVTYKVTYNPNVSRCQNAVRGIKTRTFANLEEAKAFAQTVEVVSAWNGIGKHVSL